MMQHYFRERGRDHEDIMERVRSKYGDNYRILAKKDVPARGLRGVFGGKQIEYFGYVIDKTEARQVQKSRDSENRAAILSLVGVDAPKAVKDTAEPKNSQGMDQVLQEIRSLRGQLAIGASTPPAEPFRMLSELTDILRENEFENRWIEALMEDMRGSLTASELEDRRKVHDAAALAIAKSIAFFQLGEHPIPRIFILVGPTGVGKTTTIAKLAAVYGLSDRSKDVRIITVDSFRIGARAQVETYGEIMDIPVLAVDDYDQLKAQIALASEADLILVDTIGKSPRDRDRIDEMRKLLSACGPDASVHLALSATTKTQDLRDILKQFQSFDYSSVVITKLDETSRVGNLISALSDFSTGLSYITDGQSVPVDIAIASPARLLGMVKGIDFNSDVLKELRPAVDLTAAWR